MAHRVLLSIFRWMAVYVILILHLIAHCPDEEPIALVTGGGASCDLMVNLSLGCDGGLGDHICLLLVHRSRGLLQSADLLLVLRWLRFVSCGSEQNLVLQPGGCTAALFA